MKIFTFYIVYFFCFSLFIFMISLLFSFYFISFHLLFVGIQFLFFMHSLYCDPLLFGMFDNKKKIIKKRKKNNNDINSKQSQFWIVDWVSSIWNEFKLTQHHLCVFPSSIMIYVKCKCILSNYRRSIHM